MAYNRIPTDASQTPGYLCQVIIDAAYYHYDDVGLMQRMLYESFRALHAQGIAPRADSKSGYILMVGGEDKHIYAEVRLTDTVKRANVIERINNFRIPDKPPISTYLFEAMASDIAVLASQIVGGFNISRNTPTLDEDKQAYTALVADFKDFGAHDATLYLTPNNRYHAGLTGRMSTADKQFSREARLFVGTNDGALPLTQDEQRAMAIDLIRDLAGQGGVKVTR